MSRRRFPILPKPKNLPKRESIPSGGEGDRNFDDLAHRFKRNVYDRLKGDIRLAVLKRDLQQWLPEAFHFDDAVGSHDGVSSALKPLKILDAGGGQAQFSCLLAEQGHQVTVCDISSEMLSLARDNAAHLQVEDRMTFHLTSIQDFCAEHPRCFDLILCHAVVEWVVEPQLLLEGLVRSLKNDGHLSLTYYNVNGIKMKNLLRANFQKILEEDYQGYRGSLTPTFPRQPEDVHQWLAALPLELLAESGIRCFHDYILEPDQRVLEPEKQLELELRFSQQEPWRSLGRYIHVFSRRSFA